MKLHTKLTLVLLLGIMVVVSGVQIAQYLGVTSRFSRQSEEDLAVLREREQTSARNICDTIGQAVSSSLQRGEMDKFARLLDQQRNIKGLLEFSLINRDGQVTHSSQPASLKRMLPDDLRRRFATDLHEYTLTQDDRIEIYRPQLVTADCTRCHTSWNVGEQGGVTYFAFSTAELANAEKESRVALATAQGELSRNSLVAVVAVVAVLATSVFFLVRRLIGRPLNLFTPLLTQFESGHGDLTQRIDYASKDEIGNLARLFNLFLADLETAVSKSQTTARAVGDGASSQAAAVQETSAAVCEITSTMKNNAERAQQANDLMRLANSGISQANLSMQSASTTMEDVAAATHKISSITRTINEIAAKTTLLAINAAVEAARAGQAGAGFAVVAGNVRQLASQSAEAASGIGKIIEDATARIQRGTDLVKASHAAFGDVATKSTSAAQLMDEIALTSKEQARGMDQISQAVANIDKATQQNAGQSEELLQAMSAFQTSHQSEDAAQPACAARH